MPTQMQFARPLRCSRLWVFITSTSRAPRWGGGVAMAAAAKRAAMKLTTFMFDEFHENNRMLCRQVQADDPSGASDWQM